MTIQSLLQALESGDKNLTNVLHIKVGDKECTSVPKDSKMFINNHWEDVVCKLDGLNVTWMHLKNLITDTPAPITLPLKSRS